MSIQNIIKVSIEPTWNIVQEINDQIVDLLPGKEQMIIDSVRMVATELIENAVKYCEPCPGIPEIQFELTIEKNHIVITVANGVKTKANAEAIKKNIGRIQKSKDHALLYTERLTELMNNPVPGVSQLGLYRIAYEGRFSLDYKFIKNVLTITAKREL